MEPGEHGTRGAERGQGTPAREDRAADGPPRALATTGRAGRCRGAGQCGHAPTVGRAGGSRRVTPQDRRGGGQLSVEPPPVAAGVGALDEDDAALAGAESGVLGVVDGEPEESPFLAARVSDGEV